MALSGDLSDFSLEQILRFLDANARSGTLTVRSSGGRIAIDLVGGAVTKVRGGDDDGLAALGAALAAQEGTFAFAAGQVEGSPLACSLDELCESARAQAMAMREVRDRVPGDDVAFRLSERAMNGDSFTVSPEELRVLTSVQGGRSVTDLRHKLRLPTAQVRSTVASLVTKGLIEVTDRPTDIVVSTVEARPSRKRERSPATSASADSPAAPEVEIVLAEPSAVDTRDIDQGAFGSELDARLAALSELVAPSPPPAAPERPAVLIGAEEVAAARAGGLVPRNEIVVTPAPPEERSDEATVVFRLHYAPEEPTAAPADAPPPERRGLFGLLMRGHGDAKAKDATLDVPAPAELGALANALWSEYERLVEARRQLGSFSDRTASGFDERIPARLARIYQSHPIGRRIPTSGDGIDVVALRESSVAPSLFLPYLALLVRELRDEARRVLGKDATEVYAATAARIFGREVESPTRIFRAVERPIRGRLTVAGGPTVELRDRTLVIGRARDCDVVLSDESVSGHHAQLVADLKGFRLKDLGSTNGTWVDGAALRDERTLRGGEALAFGNTRAVFEDLTAKV